MARKTNAMRLLDQKKIQYQIQEYPSDEIIAAKDVAHYFGQSTSRLFKTLVTTDQKHYYVFCLPACDELNLKHAAKIAKTKKIEMLKQHDLLPLTGYVHGGCSPIGMKKVFPTFVCQSALDYETIYVSGGQLGLQIELNPRDLEKLLKVQFVDLKGEEE